ncbi:MAG: alpha-ketoglutarate-dependent dioxygenase AlkB [Acidimicrobiales bacterium]
MATLQGSLFDTASEPRLRPLCGAVRRFLLSDGAWVDHLPGWVERADLLFEALIGEVAWRSEERVMYDRTVEVPRLMASFGDGVPAPHSVLDEARSTLAGHYLGTPGAHLATIGLCLYRDGSDSVAWHGDTIGRGATEDTLVAIVSLGWHRRLALRPRRGGARSLRFEVGGGDLLVMGGSCQRTWEHAVPKTTRPVGPRMSVQFRPLGVR